MFQLTLNSKKKRLLSVKMLVTAAGGFSGAEKNRSAE
jgi:hypothetical protein